jgi:GAF domain-containing protein
MRAVLRDGAAHVEIQGDEQIVSLPILFRGETLGAISFAVPAERPVSERSLEMAQIVVNRLSLALENTRLFEQSQMQALRERKASDVAQQLISANDVRSVLNLAAESFNQALGAVRTRVYLQPDRMMEPGAQPQSEEVR